jgi:hypothetical protein
MEANNELTRTQLLASPPTRLDDVDAWLAKYNAVIDAARAEALRVERLRDSAPALVKALQAARNLINGSQPKDLPGAIMVIDAALSSAGAA